MTTIQPLNPGCCPTPLFGAPGNVLLDPNHEFAPAVIQDGMRASWWAPAFSEGAAATGLADVADAIDAPYTPPSPQFDLATSGTPTVTIAGARWDRAVTLNGTTDYFSNADHADLRVDEGENVTFTAWVYLTSKSTFRFIFSKQQTTGEGQVAEYALFYDRTTDRFKFSGVAFNVLSSASPSLNTWYFLVATIDADNLRVGLQVNAGAPNYAAGTTNDIAGTEFRIGAGRNGFFWQGRLDEITRWNRLLTPNEIEWLLQNDLWNGVLLVSKAASGNPIEDEQPEVDPGDTPTDLTLALDGTEVDLYWTINAIGPGNWHQVFRSVDGAAFAFLGNASPGESTFHDSTADTSLHAYAYKVRARNKNGVSDYSEEINSSGFVDPEGGHFVDPETGGILQDPES